MSHYYRERHEGANQQSDDEPVTRQKLGPNAARTHADLDTLATQRGHTWSSDDLTVAQKQGELDSA